MPFIGAAIGAIAAAGSIGGAIAGAGTVAAFAINAGLAVGVSLGLGALSKALSPKPKAGDALSGVETSVQIGGDVARQIVVGTAGVRGQLVYHNTNGSDNQYYQQVFVLSDWISEGLMAVFIDGVRHWLTAVSQSGPVTTYVVPGYEEQFRIEFWNGTQTVASANLIANANPAGKWTGNSILAGMTYAAVFWTYAPAVTTKLYENGIPELMFELQGARLYDWRKDSTNGGSGPHRWDLPSTWEYSDNPVVATYNFQRGFYLNGERILGMGVPPYDLIHETYTAAANVCDEIVVTTGLPERRYRCASILTADAGVPHATSLEVLLSTFAGYLYDYGGSYYCQAGAAQLPVKTVTDGDLVVGATVTYSAKRSRAELVNRIHGQFLDPSLNYDPQSYTAQVSDGGTINDGEELGRELDLLSVPSRTQAERIAKIRLREARAQASASLTLGFNHVDLQVGDWITWNSARFGLKTWRIVNRQVDAQTRAVSLELAEINADVFSWSAADEGAAPAAPVGILPGTRMTTVTGFGFQPVSVQSANSATEIPGLKFFWDPIQDPTVDGVVIEYRIEGETAATRVTDNSPLDSSHLVTNGVVSGTNYEARATIVTTPARATTWTPWFSAYTTEFQFLVTLNWLTAQLRKEIQAASDRGEGTLRDSIKQLHDKVEELAASAATEAGSSYEARQLIKVSIGEAFAAIQKETRLRVSDVEALAELITTLTARINNEQTGLEASASAIESISVAIDLQGSGPTATSKKITTLEAELANPAEGTSALARATESLKTAVGLQGSGATARAEKIVALQTAVDGHALTLTQYGSSIDGVRAEWGVTWAYNGAAAGGIVLTGMRRLDGSFETVFGISGTLVVDGTIFGQKLAATNIITASAQIGSAIIDGAHIKNLTVDNLNIKNGAVSQTVSANGGTSASVALNVRAGAKVRLTGYYRGDSGTSTASATKLRIFRNGILLDEIWVNYYWFGPGSGSTVYPLQTNIEFEDQPGAGTHTYQVTVGNDGGLRIIATELSR